MEAVFLTHEDVICPVVAGESRGVQQRSSGGLTESKGEECSIIILNAEEEQRRRQFVKESLMATLNEYKVPIRNLENKWEKEGLNRKLRCRI